MRKTQTMVIFIQVYTRIKKIIICWFSLVLLSNYVLANTEDTFITDGGLYITPSFEVGLAYDNNAYNEADSVSGSAITTFIPAINFKTGNGIDYYSFDIKAEKGKYETDSSDNYTNGYLGLSGHIEPSDTHRFDISVKGEWLTEHRGTGITSDNYERTDEPITYGKNKLAATYEYGALQTKGRIAFDIKYSEKEYRNFFDITRRSNYDSRYYASRFYYSTRANTDALIEVSSENIRYEYNQQGVPTRDSVVYKALLGMQWEASSIMQGFIKLGGEAKEFTDTGREDFTGFSWNIGGVWQPLTYSKISFSTSQKTKDPDQLGDYILETKYNLDWKHFWTSYTSTSFGIYQSNEDYSGITRSDDSVGFNLNLNYGLTENIEISAFVLWDRNSSTDSSFEYDKNVIGANFILTL